MNRKEALSSIKANVENEKLIQHMLAAEAIMRALARKLGEDEDEWGLTGLFHDMDIELVQDDINSHSKLGADIATELGASEAMAHAILCHNEVHGVPRETKLDKALFCADALSEFITAAALAHPNKLKGLTAKSVLKRFKEKRFAAEINREQVAGCQELGLQLGEFITLGLEAMKGMASKP